MFIRFEGQKQVCRLYTDRKLQLILTTQPDEKAVRQRFMDSGMTMVEAIEKMYLDETKNQRSNDDWKQSPRLRAFNFKISQDELVKILSI